MLKYKKEALIFLVIAAAYFLVRLPHLTLQPIFADEAIYIRWSQVMRSEPTLRFLPLSDGKTPLYMWILIPFFKLFHDPLFAGRFLSVISGFFTMLGVFALSSKVFNKKVGFWASFFYAVAPYTVFFDRIGLVDSMLSAFTIWSVFFAIWLVQKVRLDLAMILGFILGGGWLTKTPAFLNLLLLPSSILVFKKTKSDQYRLVKLVVFWGVALFIALAMYNMLRLGPNFNLLSSRNEDYIFSPVELLGRPLDPFIPHFHDMSDWFPKLLTWPILLCFLWGVVKVIKDKNKLGWVILIWAAVPMLLSMAFLKTFTARYLLTSIPLFLTLAGLGVENVSRKLNPILLLIIIIPLPILFDYQLIANPPPSSLPKEETKGYFEAWTAGYGLKDIAGYLIDREKEGKVVVGTEGTFGTLPDGLYIYLDKSGISVIGSNSGVPSAIKEATKSAQVFFVGNRSDLKSIGGLETVKEYPKLGGDATVLYRVKP